MALMDATLRDGGSLGTNRDEQNGIDDDVALHLKEEKGAALCGTVET